MKVTRSLLAFLASIPCMASAQVITNGNFSTGGVRNNVSSMFLANDGAVPGWTYFESFYGGVGVWDPATPPSTAIGGNLSYDPWAPMTPSTDGGQFGVLFEDTIYQDVTGFLPDTQYQVSFEIANMYVGITDASDGTPQDDTSVTSAFTRHAWSASMPVYLNDTVQNSLSTPVIGYPTTSAPNQSLLGPWSLITLTFTTQSNVTPSTPLRLAFGPVNPNNSDPHDTAGGGSWNWGPQFALDGISVTQVPEVSTSFSLLAVMGLYLNSRRRPVRKAC